MNAKKCKLLRKIAVLIEENSQKTLYFKNENTGVIRVGKCARANYLAAKNFQRKKSVRRSYLKTVVRELLEQKLNELKELEQTNV